MKKKIGAIVGSCAACLMTAASAMASTPWIDVSSITVDTESVSVLGLTILAGLAGIWGLRKLIKTMNRS